MAIVVPPIERIAPETASSSSLVSRLVFLLNEYFNRLTEITKTEARWDRATFLGIASLTLFWAFRMYSTWGTWGTLSIDSGHEAYVPAALAQGQVLYRDVFWMYTPLAPYINATLFRIFGIHLEVLYWAGSIAALGSAILLFLIGERLSSRLVGWTAAAVLLVEAFHSWHFCFPLPYSFAPVYGCLAACFFLWCVVQAPFSRNPVWIFLAACAASVALLLKIEFGVACYVAFCVAAIACAILQRSWGVVLHSILAALPGLIVCAIVAHWMVSLAGASFITQENIMSWPTHYFMRTYGKVWLEKTGFSLSPAAFGQAAELMLYFVGVVILASLTFRMKRLDAKSILLPVGLFVALLAYGFVLGWPPLSFLVTIFFPRDMVLYVCIAAVLAAFFFCRGWREASPNFAAIVILLFFTGLLAARLLLKMVPGGYPIYYNGPVLVAYLLLLRPIVPRRDQPERVVLRSELLICIGCLAVAAFVAIGVSPNRSNLVELRTSRGSIFVPSQVAANYRVAIQFIQEKNRKGELVLSVPEDVSLYFLSGQNSPSRLYQFSPGVVAPGKMTDEVISEIERKPVHYLLWSNRTYPDYGTSVFGADYNQELGAYLTSHYQPIGPLVPHSDVAGQTRFYAWERRPTVSYAASAPGAATLNSKPTQ